MSEEEKPYVGPEKRKDARRIKQDRRQDIRFEPDKQDRRQTPGRRKGDKDNNMWRNYDA